MQQAQQVAEEAIREAAELRAGANLSDALATELRETREGHAAAIEAAHAQESLLSEEVLLLQRRLSELEVIPQQQLLQPPHGEAEGGGGNSELVAGGSALSPEGEGSALESEEASPLAPEGNPSALQHAGIAALSANLGGSLHGRTAGVQTLLDTTRHEVLNLQLTESHHHPHSYPRLHTNPNFHTHTLH